MKKIIISLISLISIEAFAQNFQTLDSTYLMVTQDFKISIPGDTLYFTTGGISMINSEQLEVMQEIMHLVNDEALDEAIGLSISENEKKIEECKSLYENLLANSNKSHEITSQSLMTTQKSLEEIRHSLEQTKNALVLANDNVTTSKELLNKYKSARLWQNILVGLAGVGLGVILTQ
ncbi:MAG: hypothetical protein RLO17_04730 [Cyclobacteriaceae bacterium]